MAASLAITNITISGAAVDLDSDAPDDFSVYGDGNFHTAGSAPWTRKSGGGATITAGLYGSTPELYSYNDSPRTLSWTGGTPNATGSGWPNGIYDGTNDGGGTTVGGGYVITVPASTTARRIRIYWGTWACRVTVEASLSDASAPPVSNSTTIDTPTGGNGVVEIEYEAGGAATLTVNFFTNRVDSAFGNTTLQAVTTKAIGSADVTVDATGVAATGAVGTVGPAADVPITSATTTGAVGSVVAEISVSLTGVSSAGSVGDVAPATEVALTGEASAGAVGDVTAATGEVVELTGVEASGETGTVGVDIEVALSGVQSAGAAGDVTFVSSDVTVQITGVAATGVVGTVVPGGDISTGSAGLRRQLQQLQIEHLARDERKRLERIAHEKAQRESEIATAAPPQPQAAPAVRSRRERPTGHDSTPRRPVIPFRRDPGAQNAAIIAAANEQFAQIQAALSEVRVSSMEHEDEEDLLLLASLE